MENPKIFTDEEESANDIFTDFEDDESVESFSDYEIRIDEER